MAQKQELPDLSQREFQIMQTLWTRKDNPMIASEIAAASSLSINTVHAVIKKLLKNGYIKVADIVYSGTVLSRAYEPIISFESYSIQQVVKDYEKARSNLSLPNVVVTLLGYEENEKEAIDQLEVLLQERKNKLNINHTDN